MKTLNEFKNEQMTNPKFREEYEKIQPEMDVIRAIVDARISQNLTQKELAERTGINQADISRLENGTRNPTLKLLQRLADGMGMQLRIEFVPKSGKKSRPAGLRFSPRFLSKSYPQYPQEVFYNFRRFSTYPHPIYILSTLNILCFTPISCNFYPFFSGKHP